MADYKDADGTTYSERDLRRYAVEEGLSFEEYLEEYGLSFDRLDYDDAGVGDLFKSAGASTALGFVSFAEGLSDLKDGLIYTLTVDDDELTAEQREFAMQSIKDEWGGDPFEKYMEQLEQQTVEFDEESITQTFGAGEYAEGGFRAVAAGLQSLPSILAAGIGPIGLIGLAASTAGSKYEEEFELDPEQEAVTLLLNSAGSGVIEAGFEFATRGLMKRAGLIKGLGGEANMKLAKEIIQGGAANIVKNVGSGMVTEAASEAATELTSVLWDQLTLGRKVDWEKKIYEIADAGIVGGLVGGVMAGAGEVKKKSRASQEMAYAVLQDDATGEELTKRQEKLKELILDQQGAKPKTKEEDPDGEFEFLEDQINQTLYEIGSLKNRSIQGLRNLNKGEFATYFANIKKGRGLKKIINGRKSETSKAIAQKQYSSLMEENMNLLRESSNRKLEDVLSKAEKTASQRNGEIKTYKTQDEYIEAMSGVSSKKILNKKTGTWEYSQAFREAARDHRYSDGMIKDGISHVNLETAKKLGSISVAGHEVLHSIMDKYIKNDDGTVSDRGIELIDEMLDGLSTKDRKVLDDRIDKNYRFNRNGTEKSKQDYYDEYINSLHDAIVKKEITYSRTWEGIGGVFGKVPASFGYENLDLSKGKDLFNLIRTYSRVMEGGKSTAALDQIIKESKDAVVSDRKSINLDAGGENVDLNEKIDPLTEGAKTKEQLQEGGMASPFSKIYTGILDGSFDRLFGSVSQEQKEIQRANLADRFMNYDPALSPSLYAWMVGGKGKGKEGNVEYAAKVAKKELVKRTEKTKREKPIDRKTSEGELTDDITDTTATPEEQLIAKEKAKKAKAKKSAETKLREKLNLNNLKQKIEKSVRLAFGVKLPDVKFKGFKLALAKAFDSALFKTVKDSMGTREAYVDWIKTYIPYLHGKKKLTPGQWIQLERNVPEGKKIFATRRRITNTQEVLDLQSKGLLPLSAKTEEGPWLITMLTTPSAKQIEAFFTGKNIKEVLGYTISTSAKGTRKDSIAKAAAINLGFDATMEVAQEPEVLKKWQGINELNNLANYENQIEILGKQIDRDPGYRHSRSLDNAVGLIGATKTKAGVKAKTVQANFYGNRDAWLVEIADEGAYTKDSMRKLMDDMWTDDQIPPVMKTKIIADYVGLLKPFVKRITTSPVNPDFKNIVEYVWMVEADQQIDMEVGKFLGLKESIQSYFDDKGSSGQLKQYQGFVKDLLIRRLNKLGDTLANRERVILEAIKYKNFIENSGTAGKRGSAHGGKQAFIDNHLTAIDPTIEDYKFTTKEGVRTIKLKRDGKWSEPILFPKVPSQEINQDMIDGTMSKEEADWREAEAKKDWKYLNELMEDANALMNEVNDYSVIEIAMLMKGLLGNMNTVLRSSANFEYSPVNPPTRKLTRTVKNWNAKKKKFEYVTKKNFEFEHGLTARSVGLLLLGHHVLGGKNKIDLDLLQETYSVGAIHVDFNQNLNDSGLGKRQQLMYEVGDKAYKRWFNFITAYGPSHAVKSNRTGKVHGASYAANWQNIKANRNSNSLNSAEANQLKYFKDGKTKGISVFDFDETVGISENFVIATKDGVTQKISSRDWPLVGESMKQAGWEMDFEDFNKVTKGKVGPLMQKLKNQIKKYGNKNVFILTARTIDSAGAIHAWLKSEGVDLPLKNITGLGNSTGAAKADWMISKLAEGYNDFYFVDDAMSNVKAVNDLLNQFDVKSKVVQTRTRHSNSLYNAIDIMLEENEGIIAGKKIDSIEAELAGLKKRKGIGAGFFNTPGSNDFMGLMYTIANARGKKGEAQLKFFEDNLYRPYRTGVQRINQAKQDTSSNYKTLLDTHPNVAKLLKKQVPGTNFTYDTAVRVYLWSNAGHDIPGLSSENIQKLVDIINNNESLVDFAGGLAGITNIDGNLYTKPEESWGGGTILSDLDRLTNNVGRKKLLQKFIDNREKVFGKWKNGKLDGSIIAKLEAAYGSDYVDALNDILWAMENGNHRPSGQNAQVNKWLNWISNSVGAIMFFNTRSAILQTLSTVNFINWGDNNPVKAAKAFADFPQYLKDFTKIFNSDFLKQRRGGLKLDVNEARLAKSVNEAGGNKVKAMLAHLLKMGFLPTRVADSFAIAAGGATFLRNRINTYINKGMPKGEAETKAWQDMIDSSEPVQQSSDPSLISREQRSVLGMTVLAFQNVTMQYSRRMKKAIIDLAKGRGDVKTNVSRIVYYGVVQNLVFNALQSALFSLAFDDDEDKKLHKRDKTINGMLDSLLRGLGIPGAVVATSKNTIIEYAKQKKKGWSEDQTYTLLQLLNISPPIGSKARKFYSSTQTEKFNKKIIPEMSVWDISNPRYQSIGNAVEAITNVPMGRTVNKINNVKQALDSDNATWQRIAMMLGWNRWDVGVKDSDILRIKGEVKKNKSNNKKVTNKYKHLAR